MTKQITTQKMSQECSNHEEILHIRTNQYYGRPWWRNQASGFRIEGVDFE